MCSGVFLGYICATSLKNVIWLHGTLNFVFELSGEVISEEYTLEYGTDKIEMHVGAVQAGERALVIDDLIATGGTLCAAMNLLGRCSAYFFCSNKKKSLRLERQTIEHKYLLLDVNVGGTGPLKRAFWSEMGFTSGLETFMVTFDFFVNLPELELVGVKVGV